MTWDYDGKRALVTGAAPGMGRATAAAWSGRERRCTPGT
jgi:NAD(P)-dependent dehydrogenase (short-subunit alcohol dehydrogenase family)